MYAVCIRRKDTFEFDIMAVCETNFTACLKNLRQSKVFKSKDDFRKRLVRIEKNGKNVTKEFKEWYFMDNNSKETDKQETML